MICKYHKIYRFVQICITKKINKMLRVKGKGYCFVIVISNFKNKVYNNLHK